MDDSLKRRIEKYLSPNDKGKVKELRSSSDIVQTDNQPYDRLRKRLRRGLHLPSGMPDVFDYGQDQDEDDNG